MEQRRTGKKAQCFKVLPLGLGKQLRAVVKVAGDDKRDLSPD